MKKREENKQLKKGHFSVSIWGMVLYSIALIAVMAGSYFGIKEFVDYRENIATAEEVSEPEETEEVQKVVIDEPEEVEEEPETEDEPIESTDELNEHSIDLAQVYDGESRHIDYKETLFEPARRNKKLTWEDSVFSRIENTQSPMDAVVNTYEYKRVYGYLLDGTKMVFHIYTNPETKLIEKIRTVSFCGENEEVITYYYNLGNLNYISHYQIDVDSPVNIASAQIQSRYYFSHDVMVKYVYCENEVATEYLLSDIDSYSEGTVKQYDFMEDQMINYAYINYNVAKGIDETEQVSGYVLDENNNAISNAYVTLERESDGAQIAETYSNGDGVYSFEIATDNSSKYKINISKDGMRAVSIYNVTAISGSGEYYAEPVYMSYEANAQEYNLQILVRDATDMTKALPFASIKYREGINNINGEVVTEGTLNEAGAIITPIRAGDYTAEVALEGYENAYFSVVVKQDHQAVLGYAVPEMAEDTYTAILSWDTTPLDLDARVITSNAVATIRSTIDSIGSTTPEVCVINNAGTDEYSYFVSDYSACSGGDLLSYNMSGSNAIITVYDSNGIRASYHVPVAHSGVVWEVFKIRNREIIPVNLYYYSVGANSFWKSK